MFGFNRREVPWHVSSPILIRLIYGNPGFFSGDVLGDVLGDVSGNVSTSIIL